MRKLGLWLVPALLLLGACESFRADADNPMGDLLCYAPGPQHQVIPWSEASHTLGSWCVVVLSN